MLTTPRSPVALLLAAAVVAGWSAAPCSAQFRKRPGTGQFGIVGTPNNRGGVVGTPNNLGGGVLGTPNNLGGVLGNQGQTNQGNLGFQGNLGQNLGGTGQGQWWQNGVPLPILTGTFLGRQVTAYEFYDNLLTRLQYQQALTSGNPGAFGVLGGSFGQFGGGLGQFAGNFGQFGGGSFGQFGGNAFVGGPVNGNPILGVQFGANPFGGQFNGNPLAGQFGANSFAGQFGANPFTGIQPVAGFVGNGFNVSQPQFGGGLLGNPGLGFVGGFGR
jgi:hypothetical protein